MSRYVQLAQAPSTSKDTQQLADETTATIAFAGIVIVMGVAIFAPWAYWKGRRKK